MQNIAVLMDQEGKYHYCPVFDNGAGLLSDITMDYPMHVDGQPIKFEFGESEIRSLLDREKYYSKEIKERIMNILLTQRRKYRYLFQR